MFEFIQSVSSEIVAGLLGITGAIVGGKIANNSAHKVERKKLLSELYAEVFSNHFLYVLDHSIENKKNFFISVEKTTLFCSKKSEIILIKMLEILAQGDSTSTEFTLLIDKLHESAKADINKT